MSKYDLIHNWFGVTTHTLGYPSNMEVFEEYVLPLAHLPQNILEIGSHEGASTVWFSDWMLDHSESKLTCVDPFIEPYCFFEECDPRDSFYRNISLSEHGDRINVYEELSSEFFSRGNDDFTIVYVDGDHNEQPVLEDCRGAWAALLPDGLLILDDYLWEPTLDITLRPQRAIETFIEETSPEVVYSGFIVILKKNEVA